MKITVHHEKVFEILDVLLARWNSNPKQYPYTRSDAILPQAVALPDDLRADKKLLANYYFYVCIYMRGGIESLQAFRALVSIWRQHPELFDPYRARWVPQPEVQSILKEFIGWDSKAASINWVENSRQLVQHWDGHALNLAKGLGNYAEALRRIKNKRTKREFAQAGADGGGFRGFQPKMVSMLVYFFDWEGWLKPRFLYPSPADFHNFRLGLTTGAIEVSIKKGESLSASEKLSAPWREAVMAYLKTRKADPIELADALWLFSLVMCGNSPVTITKSLPVEKEDGPKSFGFTEIWDHAQWVMASSRKKLEETCLVCPFLLECKYGIPAQPYYRKGKLILRPRPPIERDNHLRLVKIPKAEVEEEPHPTLFPSTGE